MPDGLGAFIRAQRQQAELTLRELAARTNVSNPYLSQIERGLHEPSVRVLKAIAGALNVSAETLLAQAGLFEADGDEDTKPEVPTVIEAVKADPRLNDDQRRALLSVYRSFVDGPVEPTPGQNAERRRPGGKGVVGLGRSPKGPGKRA
jgi:transcriptional regulator with XRE-family HTH domain